MKKAIFLIGSTVLSSLAYAGDDPVNCRSETHNVSVYGGYVASCTTSSGTDIRQYVTPSTTSFIRLHSHGQSCTTSLRYYGKQTVTSSQCDYTPKANLTLRALHDGTAYEAALRVSGSGSDRDGSIVSEKFWLNGAYKGSSISPIKVRTATRFTVKYEVTDNSGYTDSQTKTIWVNPQSDPCREGVSSC
ncbi:hypothetical protein J8L98_07715 [Pseudoalteromonas sp. MMG013]|uniref:hypothetical protein n=1 Tax=Pseudoalteromonas sp. MMG013 TaxID=2822687 RepID=UPI001B36B752|nr:hypothetical protein [Pseudoalteromonas sp. MMG013]MBQ4861575.1 hypothetical protein [Pseudoalteromonas sp. MMG013]